MSQPPLQNRAKSRSLRHTGCHPVVEALEDRCLLSGGSIRAELVRSVHSATEHPKPALVEVDVKATSVGHQAHGLVEVDVKAASVKHEVDVKAAPVKHDDPGHSSPHGKALGHEKFLIVDPPSEDSPPTEVVADPGATQATALPSFDTTHYSAGR